MLIDVALNPAEISRLPARDLSDTVCVVFDILRATSSMITALAHGVAEIHPVLTLEDALARRSEAPGSLAGGERNGERPDSFDFGNSPFEYRNSPGATVFWTTSNGTVALRACAHAKEVLVGAFLNQAAVVEAITQRAPERLLLVAAGTHETLALEDVCAAGHLAAHFPEAKLTDEARTALALAAAYPQPRVALGLAANGRALIGKGREAEVDWCAQISVYKVVGRMDGLIVRPTA